MSTDEGYLTMGLDCAMDWPSQEREVCFRGHILTLKPETDTLAPSIVIKTGGSLSQKDARRLLQEFLSGLAWARGGGVSETFSAFCTGASLGVGKGTGRLISDCPIEYVPDPTDPKAKLALALYREALSVNMIPYMFLGFFKILNVLYNKGDDQKKWINASSANITEREANARLKELQKTQSDIGDYLYGSGRCAVAHAFSTPIVNPDHPEDLQRLSADMPLVRALAEYAIEHEFGVKSLPTVNKEHLYELEGFKDLFGVDTVHKLKTGEQVQPSALQIPNKLSLRLRDKETLTSFEDMDAQVASAYKGTVAVLLRSANAYIEALFHLLFTEERLVFDANKHLGVHDDGSEAAAAARIDALRFLKGWQANGVNEIWDTSAKKRLGRSEPVFLVNWRPNWDVIDQEIADLESRISKGKATSFL